jgi:hypothetical protein
MTRPAKRNPPSPEVQAAYVVYIENVFLNQMKGMLRAKKVEEQYLKLLDRIRDATQQEIAGIARKAAEHFVSHFDSNSALRSQVDRLKKAAFDHALQS